MGPNPLITVILSNSRYNFKGNNLNIWNIQHNPNNNMLIHFKQLIMTECMNESIDGIPHNWKLLMWNKYKYIREDIHKKIAVQKDDIADLVSVSLLSKAFINYKTNLNIQKGKII